MFVGVCDVVIKAQFIVKEDASVLKALHHLHRLAVDRSGAMKGGEFTAGVKDELLRDAEVDPVCPRASTHPRGQNLAFHRFRSVVVITFASHAKGPRSETGRKQFFLCVQSE